MKCRFRTGVLSLLALVFITTACNKQQDLPALKPQDQASQDLTSNASATFPKPDHIVIVVMENHGYSQVMGTSSAPYINALAKNSYSANFTKSYAIMHPSQPNYLCLFSGSNQGVTNDNNPPNDPFTTANLAKQLISAGKSYKTYSEDLPSVGWNGDSYGAYRRKHNPAANWMGSGTNQIPTSTNQPFTAFPTDFTKLPTVSIVVPNQNNDMHDGSVTTGDTWLKNKMDKYIQWAKTHNSLFILTFDEDDDNHGNQIVTIATGSMVKAGQYSTPTINHYNVLRTIENMYALPYAGNAAKVSTITNCWK